MTWTQGALDGTREAQCPAGWANQFFWEGRSSKARITLRVVMRNSPLVEQARHAGATTVQRGGVRVAAHYGSPAGELSACVRAVGLGDRSDLGIFTLSGSPTA